MDTTTTITTTIFLVRMTSFFLFAISLIQLYRSFEMLNSFRKPLLFVFLRPCLEMTYMLSRGGGIRSSHRTTCSRDNVLGQFSVTVMLPGQRQESVANKLC